MQPIGQRSSFGMSGTLFHAPFLDVHPDLIYTLFGKETKNLAAEKISGYQAYRSFEEIIADPQVDW